ncbi:MAG: asparagine synthase (glutamine-hydrolyzing) [Ignavibacteriaceae bacterium]|nr:asparagine synthase (glutamine-hydrolyzing) [Ignavibacteriaceae bacterium]
MCGLFAAINFNSNYTNEDYHKFISLTDMVAYRGPDSHSYLGIESTSKIKSETDFNIFLGHRRLSIIDLSFDGLQPMEDDNVFIIFNGEIFNFIEIRDELAKEGSIFRTKTDTEVILKLYKKYGEKSFERLNGMWAFIIVDLNKKRVIISRDRFSIKPIYYYKNKGSIFFGSEIKQLIPLLSKKDVNDKILSLFLKQGILDHSEETFIKDIIKVKAKTNLIINLYNSDIREESYWDYNITDINDLDQASNGFKELLIDSIKIRLRSDVEIGSLLSGGLDSSAISHIGNKLQHGELKTYSVISRDKKYSEEDFIDLFVKEEKVFNKKIVLMPEDIIENFDKVLYHQDEPFSNFIVMAHYTILAKLKEKSDITVILSGQGGDEILMGYLRYYFFYLKNLAKGNNYLNLFREIYFSIINRTLIMQYRRSTAKRYMPKLLKQYGNYLIRDVDLEDVWKSDNMVEAQIRDIDQFSVPILARYEDRNSMAHSLEIRLPFLDHRLVNFALSLKTSLKINKGWSKYILRKSLNELPDKIRWRRDKKGFILPEQLWLKNEFSKDIIELFRNSMLDKMGIIDKNSFLKYYEMFRNNNRNIHYTEISRAFIAEKWSRMIFG